MESQKSVQKKLNLKINAKKTKFKNVRKKKQNIFFNFKKYTYFKKRYI